MRDRLRQRGVRWRKNGARIHIGLFRSDGILGQDRLFALLDVYSEDENQGLLGAPGRVTVSCSSEAIFGGCFYSAKHKRATMDSDCFFFSLW